MRILKNQGIMLEYMSEYLPLIFDDYEMKLMLFKLLNSFTAANNGYE